MVNLFPLTRKSKERIASIENRLVLIRSRKLIINLMAIQEMFDDALEKVTGEYIFDRRFVYSLIERALIRTNLLIINMIILEPESSESLFSSMDAMKRESTNFYRADGDRPILVPVSIDLDEVAEPEYRLVHEILSWLADDEHGRLLTIVRLILDKLIQCLENRYDTRRVFPINCSCGFDRTTIGLFALGTGERKAVGNDVNNPVEVLDCTPLNILCMGSYDSVTANEQLPKSTSTSALTWEAIADHDHLLLIARKDKKIQVMVHSTISHDDTTTYLLVFLGNDSPVVTIPDGFVAKKLRTATGQFFWQSCTEEGLIERSLMQWGKHLLNTHHYSSL